MYLPISISSTGVYTPRVIQLSQELDQARGWPAGKSERHSGVASRHKSMADETASIMAAQAIIATGVDLACLDRLVVTSIMPEQPIPTTAALTVKELGLKKGITAYDVNASCLGFLQAVESATTAITAGLSRCAAVAAVEQATLALDEDDPMTAALFGDGAAAAILSPAQGDAAILALCLETYPEGVALCEIPAGGTRWNIRRPPPSPRDYLFQMEGAALARLAMDRLPDFMDHGLKQAGISLAEVSCVIPHQASRLGLKFLRRWIGNQGPQMIDILADHGNQVTVSLPTALHVAVSTGRLRRGDIGMMVGTAAGFGMGVMIFRY